MSSAAPAAPPARSTRGEGPFAGTGGLLRLLLRRDRLRFPGWIAGLGLIALYFGTALEAVFQTEEDLQGIAAFSEGPVGKLLGGPGFGFDDLTIERFFAGQYLLYLLVASALMSLLTVTRHTRLEERAGRAELVRANVIGRHAPLTAALALTIGMNLVVAVVVAAVLTLAGFPAAGSVVSGAAIGAVGIAFAGVAAVTAQISQYPRAAAGMAGAVLGAAFVIRGVGDSIGDTGSWLSWLSPLAWAQQTRPWVDERWWPLSLALVLGVALAFLAAVLADRRDLDAGLRPPRPGPPAASAWLSGPLTLALRLQRASIIGWSSALVAAGFAYGSFAQPLLDGFQDAPAEILAIFGGEDDLLGGYIALMGIMMALTVAVFAVLAVQWVRSEEFEGRAEPVLATAVGRPAWLGSVLTVTAAGAAWLLLVAGVGTAAGAVVSTGDTSLFGEVVFANVVHTPAVWFVLGVATLLYGLLPRAVPVVWVLLVHAMIVAFFAPLLDLPDVASNISAFDHIAEVPVEDLTFGPIATLTALAGLTAAAGVAAFRRRDLRSA